MVWIGVGLAVLLGLVAVRMVMPRPPSRLHRAAVAAWHRIDDRIRGRRAPEPDPFEALRLQRQLGVVARQIRELEADPYVFAKVHRLEATRLAYDDLLAEACELAGVAVAAEVPAGEELRWREEQELSARGWFW